MPSETEFYWQFAMPALRNVTNNKVYRQGSPAMQPFDKLTMADGQQYTLWPNPSDGRIELRQAVADGRPVTAEIRNAVGQSIYKGELHFNGGATRLHIADAPPGMYMLQLTDSGGKRFILKFVINNQ